MKDEQLNLLNKLKYFFITIAFGITLLFIITDIISSKLSKQTCIDVGVLTSIVLYVYGDKTNKVLPLLIGVIISIISIIMTF
jgi:hypothetical protein